MMVESDAAIRVLVPGWLVLRRQWVLLGHGVVEFLSRAPSSA